MKQLLAGVVLLVVLGIAGFMYRNALEHPLATGPNTGAVACTAEAKICPDGTSVGRSGPSCSFAPCPLPSVQIPELGIAFALPTGYTQLEQGAAGQETARIFQKPTTASDSPDVITLNQYPIPAGGTANAVIIANTTYASSGKPAKSMTEFTPIVIHGTTFYSVVLERFEGQVESAYYLPRANDVLRFDILERGVADWSNPALIVANLPEHAALLHMLSTLEQTK